MDLEEREWCEASTKPALQRFTRGSRITTTIMKFLEDKMSMEAKIQKIQDEFNAKWMTKLGTDIGSNLRYDELKEVAQIIMKLEGKRSDLHSNAKFMLEGPLSQMKKYAESDEVKNKAKEIQDIFTIALKWQEHVEQDIRTSQEFYYKLQDKEQTVKERVMLLQGEGDSGMQNNFKELLAKWRRIEEAASVAEVQYKNSLIKEKARRSTFIQDMKRFHTESDKYESERLERVRNVLLHLLKTELAIEDLRDPLDSMTAKGLRKLRLYNSERDIESFNKLFSYKHKFLKYESYPGDDIDGDAAEKGKLKPKRIQEVIQVEKRSSVAGTDLREGFRNMESPINSPSTEDHRHHSKDDNSDRPIESTKAVSNIVELRPKDPVSSFEARPNIPVVSSSANKTRIVEVKPAPEIVLRPKAVDKRRINRYSRHVSLPSASTTAALPDVEVTRTSTLGPMLSPAHSSQKHAACTEKISIIDLAEEVADYIKMEDEEKPRASQQANKPEENNECRESGEESEASSHDDTDNSASPRFDGMNKLKVYSINGFVARTVDEISFKKGRKVYMTVPPNENGLAYGYVKKGKLRKKKVYGYFPAALVSTDGKKRSVFKPKNPFKSSKSKGHARSASTAQLGGSYS